ncbi:hypothetical protein CC85DRAFT_285963 [Cutaneotrichosporon oleaginosum]|uniref:Uncharacterized protein n=1 Tax=Cutaneotrichosporon oleaginosum TaxID=879819 RepID=A0A0J0XLR4_9TREE|nr:uncharacterized protein CC85DRAFT_285963 [Cutaneotrichosporon oleaginosum]KLT42035.1 hypothetical protein CC85DRAFT_285963 [Cutaneotrichosporon oleaginosum]TXT14309.1 hypothetical protein COLE_00502 [Cutaneotrichosporon oleaginosum]
MRSSGMAACATSTSFSRRALDWGVHDACVAQAPDLFSWHFFSVLSTSVDAISALLVAWYLVPDNSRGRCLTPYAY